jgi:hypothetical protein
VQHGADGGVAVWWQANCRCGPDGVFLVVEVRALSALGAASSEHFEGIVPRAYDGGAAEGWWVTCNCGSYRVSLVGELYVPPALDAARRAGLVLTGGARVDRIW